MKPPLELLIFPQNSITNWVTSPDSILDIDFKLFSDDGVRSITITSVWSYIETSSQNYNYSALDEIRRVCEFAEKYNISVIIDSYTIMQASENTDYSWTMSNCFSPPTLQHRFHKRHSKESPVGFSWELHKLPKRCSPPQQLADDE